jgi:hypothetical protein
MTRLTINEFRQEHTDGDWAARLASGPNVIEAFMLEFDNPQFLAGPFGGSYGLVTIKDARNGPNKLYTETETYNRFRTYVANNLYNMPRSKDDQAGLTTTHEYLTGRHRVGSLEPVDIEDRRDSQYFSTRNTLHGSSTLDHPHLKIASYSSGEIDGLDMLRLFRRMSETLPMDEVIKRISAAEAKIEKELQSYREHSADSTPTIEKPILLTLHGNDDSTWGKVFANVELAREYAVELEASSKAGFTYPQMNFTN